MHETTSRLYEAAKAMKSVEGQSAVGRLLNQSPQVMKNWETRGVSEGGALAAQRTIGASATWVLFGEGPMALGSINTQVVAPTPMLDQALDVVLKALGELTPGRWSMVKARLDDMPGHPEMHDDVLGDVLPILATEAHPTKARRAA